MRFTHIITRPWRRVLASFAMIAMLATPLMPAVAANATYPQDTTLLITGPDPDISLTIISGSQSDSLEVTSTTFKVTVATGESMTVRYPGPDPGSFPNDGGLPECNNVSGNNDLVINGPITVTVTPNTTVCSSSGGGGGATPTSVTLAVPNGGESYEAGQEVDVFWSGAGSEPHTMRIHLSTDGGSSYPTLVAENEQDDGFYAWTVPDVTTDAAKLRIQAVAAGDVVRAFDASDASFGIQGTGEPDEGDEPPSDGYSPSAAKEASPTISHDKDLSTTADAPCAPHSLIKLPGDDDPVTQTDSTVYYCGTDGRRHVFPNPGTYRSWYEGFEDVVEIDAETMASIPLGENVTYRPGVRMIKIQTDPRVYAVDKDGLLRWVATEDVAERLYGSQWNTMIDDVSDAFFANYDVGEPILE